MNNTSVEVTAGMGGFLVLFGLMVVVWLLGRDLTRRLRRMRLAEERRLETEAAERAATQPAESPAAEGKATESPSVESPAAPAAGRTGDGPDPIG